LICQACPTWQVIAIDLAQNMLRLGTRNLQQTGLSSQIVLELGDAKQLAYADGLFDMVISNSLVHHLPDPLPFLRELQRSLKPNGAILIRDLLRPPDQVTMDVLVARLGSDDSESQKRLFRNSLQAAFTLDEVKQLVQAAGLEETKIYQSSERHWTLERAWGQ
jgi:ubiquinone/menaquinone biosynthesis C-methylase UbiE